MPEGSPTDSAPPAEAEPTPPEATQDEQPAQSVEEVEAIWKNRVAGKDRAHAAEARALREQLAAAEARATRKAEADAGDASDADQWKAKYEAAQQAADQERVARLVEVRAAKYPLAAEALDESVLSSMDEGKLAALNARLDDGEPAPSGRVDPNSAPKRTAGPPKSIEDKSVDDLKSDLKKYGPGYLTRIGVE